MSLAAGASAQQTVEAPHVPPAAAPQHGPMTLDVVVTDKSGHPVAGLQQQDFSLTDNGHPVPIGSFAAVTPSDADQHPTSIVLVVDEVNTGFNAVSNERIQIHQFLTANQGNLPAPVSIVFLTDDGLKQVTGPSQDGKALDATFAKQSSTLRALSRASGFYGGADRASISLGALQSLTGSLTQVRGRKLVIWISPGWWLFDSPNVQLTDRQHRQFYDAVVNLSARLREANVTLYAVNPLGTENAGAIYNSLWRDFVKPVTDPNRAQPGHVALQVLAQQSGGLIFFGSNDVTGEIERCAADARVWYRLTFDPERADQPNQWHTIQVKVDKPRVTVRTRNGYYAQP